MQAVTEKREHQIKVLDEQKQGWTQAYRENYELGRRVGAHRPAVWRVVLHIVAVTLLVAACCAFIEVWLSTPITTPRLLCYVCVLSRAHEVRRHSGRDRTVAP